MFSSFFFFLIIAALVTLELVLLISSRKPSKRDHFLAPTRSLRKANVRPFVRSFVRPSGSSLSRAINLQYSGLDLHSGLSAVSQQSLQGLFSVSSGSLPGLFRVSSGSLQGLFKVS